MDITETKTEAQFLLNQKDNAGKVVRQFGWFDGVVHLFEHIYECSSDETDMIGRNDSIHFWWGVAEVDCAAGGDLDPLKEYEIGIELPDGRWGFGLPRQPHFQFGLLGNYTRIPFVCYTKLTQKPTE